jgi:hypothetical protein
VLRQKRHVSGSLAQGGHRQDDLAEPVEQVGTELAAVDRSPEIAVGGGDQADIDLDGRR